MPVIAAVLLAAGIAWVAWVAFQDRPVSAEVYGYDVQDSHTTEITLDIDRSRPVKVRCTVYAQAEDHATVGERTFVLPAEEGRTRYNTSVDTQRRAVTGVLDECTPIDD